MTAAGARIAAALARLGERAGARLAVRFTEWSLDSVAQALDPCDLVLLPADPTDETRLAASPNRLVRAVWAGPAVVAHPLPS